LEATLTTAIAQGEHMKEAANESTTAAAMGPMEVSPKEWQKHHDLWLNAVMQTVIGEGHPKIPLLHKYIQVH